MIPLHAIGNVTVQSKPVDSMSLTQENIIVVLDDVSALYRVRRTSGYSRFIFLGYAILGIIFYGIGVYTALGGLMMFLNGGAVISLSISLSMALYLSYVLLNIIIGYGFMFYRKWLITAFSSTLILMGLLTIFFFIDGSMSRTVTTRTSISMITGILLFLFLTRYFLSGSYLAPKVIIPFAGAFLFILLLTNFGMLH